MNVSIADASVRAAVVSDAPAVGVVQAAVWIGAYADRLPPEVIAQFQGPAFARAWRQSLENPPAGAHRLLVACVGAQIVGFAALGPSQDPDAPPSRGELTAFGIHPGARREGHGSRLLNAAVDTMRDLGADELGVWVRADDELSRGFLQAGGLAPDGAFRDRVIAPDGDTLREVRLVTSLELTAEDSFPTPPSDLDGPQPPAPPPAPPA